MTGYLVFWPQKISPNEPLNSMNISMDGIYSDPRRAPQSSKHYRHPRLAIRRRSPTEWPKEAASQWHRRFLQSPPYEPAIMWLHLSNLCRPCPRCAPLAKVSYWQNMQFAYISLNGRARRCAMLKGLISVDGWTAPLGTVKWNAIISKLLRNSSNAEHKLLVNDK
jgi:hypothetical protein